MEKTYEDLIKECTTLDELWALAAEIAEVYKGEDDSLQYFAELCKDQIEIIDNQSITREALELGGLIQPVRKMAKA